MTLLLGACAEPSGHVEDVAAAPAAPLWVNGDFEGNATTGVPPTGWTITPYQNRGITDTRPSPQTFASLSLVPNVGTANSVIVGGATESIADPALGTGASFRYPRYGIRAAVVNFSAAQNGTNYNANVMRQTMTAQLGDVDPVDNQVHVRFVVAPVLENPNHAYREQPYYYVELKNITRGTTLYQDFNTSAQVGVPWKITNGIYYTDWQLVDIAPGNTALAVGDQVELIVVAAGCSQSGHWGRVYVDGVASTIPGIYTWATGPQLAAAGTDITYTVNYRNGGTGAANGASLSFETPPNTTFRSVSLGAPTCSAPAVGGTGLVTCSLGSLAPGATGSFTVTARVTAGTAAGTVINAGNYAISATGVSPLLGPKVQTTVSAAATFADVGVTKTDNAAALVWGAPTSYTIVVSNAGPNAATSVTVADTMPAQLTGVTWSCVPSSGATCTSSGTGNINQTVSIPAGGNVTYTVNASIVSGTGSGSVSNTATATVGGGVTDPSSTNNAATDTTSLGSLHELTVAKTGALGGSIVSTPAAINCGTSCANASASFLVGSTVILTASAVPNATFLGWGGACASAGTATTCSLTINANTSVTAAFTPPPFIAATGGASQSTVITTPFGSPLQVRVTDSAGNPIAGQTVTFTAPSGILVPTATLSSATALTDANGYASVTATANAVVGAYNVTATVPNATTSATFALTNGLGAPASLTVTAGGTQSTVVGTAFGTELTVKVADALGNGLPGRSVTFTPPASAATAALSSTTVVTDANGIAKVTATASATAGSYTVTASSSGLPNASFSLTNTAGPIANVTRTGTPQTTAVSTAFGAPLEVTVTDANGNPKAGITVTFSAPGAGASASLSATTATTNAAGKASVTATASNTAGTYNVTATVAGFATPQTFALTNTPGAPATLTLVGGSPQSATVGASFVSPLVVRVRDTFGNDVSGQTVTFEAPTSGPRATLSATTGTTDTSGLATITATAGTIAGSYSVIARSGALTPVSFALTNAPGAPTNVALAGTPQSTTVGAAFPAPLELTVTDAFGNPAPGISVTFAVPGSGASAALSQTTATTNAAGKVVVTATANGVAGPFTVSASVAGYGTVPFSLTNVAGAPSSLVLVSGSPQSTTVGSAFAMPLVVRVVDAFGNRLSGETVIFEAPASGARATLSSTSVSTDGNGEAAITATAGTVAGAYSVIARSGSLAPAAFSLTNAAGAPATVLVEGGAAQSTTVGTAFADALVLVVTDANGNRLPNVAVSFSQPSTGAAASLSATSTTTDSNGRVSISATANTVAGSYVVAASVSGISGTTPFALTNLAGAAASFEIVSGDDQSALVASGFGAPLSVRVSDQYGNRLAGQTVTFSVPGSGPTASLDAYTVTTNAQGVASVSASAGTVAGAYDVVATTGNLAPLAFSLENTAGAPAIVEVVSGGSQSATVGTAFAEPLVLVVRDVHGNALPNVAVSFSQPGSGASASLSATSTTTDTNGRVSVTATANTIAGGAYPVTANVTGIGAPTVFSLTNLAGEPASFTIVSGDDQSTLAATAFDTALVVRVTDAFGNPLAGETVTFAVPGAGATASLDAYTLTTNAAGEASVQATAGNVAGEYVVTASSGALPALPFSLENEAGAPSTLTIESGDAQSTTVVSPFAQPLVLVVRDALGNALPNVTVTFEVPASGAGANLAQTTATTDADGRVSVTAGANDIAGEYQVLARVVGITAPATFALTNEPGPAARFDIVGGGAQSTTVDDAFGDALTVRITDKYGNPLSGQSVTFSAPVSGASAVLSGTTVTTNTQGEASITASANQAAGSYVVDATSGSLSPLAFALTNEADAAAQVDIDGSGTQSTVVATAFADALGLTVRDQFGNPLAGVEVTFTVPGAGATASLSATTVVTDADGHVSVTAEASTVAGAYAVEARVAGIAQPVVFSLTNLAGAPARFEIQTGDEQTATVSDEFGAELSVRITDEHGNPIVGETVTFTVPGTGATAALSSLTATTDANGVATVTATAGTVAGTYAVTADAASLPTVTFDLTNEAAAAATIEVTAGGSQTAVVGEAFDDEIVLVVKDEFGNPLAGVEVTFEVPSAGATAVLSVTTATTDENGEVRVTAIAGTIAGVYEVLVHVPGVAEPARIGLVNLVSAPVNITVLGGGEQSTVVDTAFAEPLTVLVTDANGNPVENVTVTFVVPSNGATAVLETLTATTDASGHASVIATAGTVAGAYEVTASTPVSTTPATFALTNEPGAAFTVTADLASSPQSAMVGTPFANELVVTVRDAFGNVVPGATVTFVVPVDGATATLETLTVVTGEDGVARVRPTAGTVAGGYTITASVPGVATPASFALTNLVGTATTLSLVSGGDQRTFATTAFAEPVVVEVLDVYGNPVPGVTITLTLPSSGASATSDATEYVTDAEGRVTIALTANALTGEYDVAIVATGAESPVVVHLANDVLETTIALEADAGHALLGGRFQLTATVTSNTGTPTGTVRFLVGDMELGTATLDENGVAELWIDATEIGTLEIRAEYVPDLPFVAATSEPVTVEVLGGAVTGGAVCSASPGATDGAASMTSLVLLGLAVALVRRRAGKR